MARTALAVMLSALGVVFVGHLGAAPQSQPPLTVEAILARHLQAKGGIEKVKSVVTLKKTGKVAFQGMNATITIYSKRPNLVRQEMEIGGQTMINSFDGTSAWQINPMTGSTVPIVMSGPEAVTIRDQSEFDSPLVDSVARGFKVELVGTEKLGEKSVYHLKVTRNQQVQHCYLDATSALEVKVTSDTPAGALEQELDDFRDVQGLKYPFVVRTLSAGIRQLQLTYDKVEPNATFDDAIFKLPRRP